jgi:hypothetical protein
MRDLPIVCTLQPGDLNACATQLLPGVVAAAKARYAIENGFRFEFQPDSEVLASIVRMIDAERQCVSSSGFSSRSKRRVDLCCSR